MKFAYMRSAIVITSLIVGSVIPSQAFAQTIDVLTGLSPYTTNNSPVESTYTFNQSMILTSIGFAVNNNNEFLNASYTLGTTTVTLSELDLLPADSNGLRWYILANGGLSVNATSVLTVSTEGETFFGENGPYSSTNLLTVGSNNASSNVTYNGLFGNQKSDSNSNLRVSNPGSSVAPEPGSFALALTGGAALIGICIRRRRNAA